MKPNLLLPKSFELLSDEDQEEYKALQKRLTSRVWRNNRNRRVDLFTEMISMIQKFCERNTPEDPLRHFVCGVCCFPGGIAVNIRQLRVLIGKCKASINGSLQKLGCCVAPKNTSMSAILCERIPLLRDNYHELREWSVRWLGPATPQPHIQVPKMEPPPEPTPETPAPSFVGNPSPGYELSVGADSDSFDIFCLPPDFLGDW